MRAPVAARDEPLLRVTSEPSTAKGEPTVLSQLKPGPENTTVGVDPAGSAGVVKTIVASPESEAVAVSTTLPSNRSDTSDPAATPRTVAVTLSPGAADMVDRLHSGDPPPGGVDG